MQYSKTHKKFVTEVTNSFSRQRKRKCKAKNSKVIRYLNTVWDKSHVFGRSL